MWKRVDCKNLIFRMSRKGTITGAISFASQDLSHHQFSPDLMVCPSVEPFESAMLDSTPSWAISSVGERFLHTEEATGSIPVSPTIMSPVFLLFFRALDIP